MIPNDRLFHEGHLWIMMEDDGNASIGITHHAQDSLGEIMYVELPGVGDAIQQNLPFGVIESVKVASDLVSPISGTVYLVNDAVPADPCCINRDPYQEGWLLKVKVSDESELASLMSPESYKRFINGD